MKSYRESTSRPATEKTGFVIYRVRRAYQGGLILTVRLDIYSYFQFKRKVQGTKIRNEWMDRVPRSKQDDDAEGDRMLVFEHE